MLGADPEGTMPPATAAGRGAGLRPAGAEGGRGRAVEVLTIGRVSVDLYPEQVGVPLARV
jgi:hypothetical protein